MSPAQTTQPLWPLARHDTTSTPAACSIGKARYLLHVGGQQLCSIMPPLNRNPETNCRRLHCILSDRVAHLAATRPSEHRRACVARRALQSAREWCEGQDFNGACTTSDDLKSLDHDYASILALRRVSPLRSGAVPLPTIAIVGTDGESGTRLSILGLFTLSGPL